jgi:photosystem II stability/assembly factor-like uncharacterized protein
VCSPTDANRYLVAGADGGVWRSTNGGTSWTALTDDQPTTAIGALALDPNDENTIYAGTGEANFAHHSRFGLGLLKSTDGGNTWAVLAADVFAGRCFARIAVSPVDSAVLYAAITPAGGFPAMSAAKGHPQADGPVGVFKSVDGGVTWSQLTNGLPTLAATDVRLAPNDSQTVYAAIGHIFGDPANGVYKSVDAGASWIHLGGGLPTTDVGRITLAIAPSMPQRLFASIAHAADANGNLASLRGVFRSDDGGVSWSALTAPNYMASFGWYANVALVHPTDPTRVIVGGMALQRSINSGASWTDVTPPHPDLHALAWDAAGRLLAGDDGGVHRSTTQGDSWIPLNTGLGLIQFYAGLSLDPNTEAIVYGGAQDNGTDKRTAPNTWAQVFGGDGGMTAVNQNTPTTVFCEFQGTGNLYRSTNAGGSFTLSASGINTADRNCFLPPYGYDPSNAQRMVYGTHRIYRSTNGGLNWLVISGDLTATSSGAIRSLAIAPSNGQTIWAATNDGNVQVTFNDGAAWQLVLTELPGWRRLMRQIFVDPLDNTSAYLAGSRFGVDQVLRTSDAGQTWMALDGDLPDVPVNVIAVDPRPAIDVLYVGAEAGVFRSLNGGISWRRYGAGLPNTPVIDLRLDLPHSRMIAGTQGRGAWRIPIWLPGDFNGDQLVDLADAAAFADCLTGPGTPPPASTMACLGAFDGDSDGDVDLQDAATFQIAFGGP